MRGGAHTTLRSCRGPKLGLRRSPGRLGDRQLRRKLEVAEEPLDGGSLGHPGSDGAFATTIRAGAHVGIENPGEELAPADAVALGVLAHLPCVLERGLARRAVL